MTEARSTGGSPERTEVAGAALDLDRQPGPPLVERADVFEPSSLVGPWSALVSWPLRRRVVAGLLAVPLIALYTQADGGGGSVWSFWAGVSSGFMAALILASYVPRPGSGRLLEVGCSPCAVAAAGAVIGSMIFWSGQRQDAGMIVPAVALLMFGLLQRLSDVQMCRSPRPADTQTMAGPE